MQSDIKTTEYNATSLIKIFFQLLCALNLHYVISFIFNQIEGMQIVATESNESTFYLILMKIPHVHTL